MGMGGVIIKFRVNLHAFCTLRRSRCLGLLWGWVWWCLNFVLTCTLSAHYVDHVAWVGYGDGWGDIKFRVNLHAFCTLRRSRCLGLCGDGCGDVKFRVNLHAFCTLRRSRCLGWVWGWVGWYLNFVLTCTLSAHYVDHVAWGLLWRWVWWC